ncbi:hypothetical protein IWX47DRAFT_277942 [Phyllosticta citricarpa]
MTAQSGGGAGRSLITPPFLRRMVVVVAAPLLVVLFRPPNARTHAHKHDLDDTHCRSRGNHPAPNEGRCRKRAEQSKAKSTTGQSANDAFSIHAGISSTEPR